MVLYRRAPGGAEVFWLKRGEKLRYAGGFFAFPGGRVDRADAEVPVEGASGQDAQLRVTAARETFEETGVLLARGADRLPREVRDEARRGLLESGLSFAAFLSRHRLTLHAADLPEAGRWLTPPFLPGRYDARFFLAEVPPGQEAEVWPGELSHGAWVSPDAALARWRDGTALLHPPNLHAVESMRGFQTPEGALERLRHPAHVVDFVARRLEFQRGVRLVPLRTATLPPATHTNAYLLGTGELLVVDPGSDDPAETDALLRFLQELEAEGERAVAVVATHHHGDHVGGLRRVVEKTGLPVWAHARTADRLPVPVAHALEDGDVLSLGGVLPMRWRVLHTPGHARGHVCLVDERSSAAVVGDLVAGLGTIVIDPPEGDMAEYLRQLQRLKALDVRTLYPAHGPALADGPGKLDEYLAHRAWRESRVLEALAQGPLPLEDVVPRAYEDVQAFVLPIAERSCLAILHKLHSEGRVRSVDGRWARPAG